MSSCLQTAQLFLRHCTIVPTGCQKIMWSFSTSLKRWYKYFIIHGNNSPYLKYNIHEGRKEWKSVLKIWQKVMSRIFSYSAFVCFLEINFESSVCNSVRFNGLWSVNGPLLILRHKNGLFLVKKVRFSPFFLFWNNKNHYKSQIFVRISI